MEGMESLRAVCSAPGKAILFGEHSVVYGHPAIALATSQRTFVEVDAIGHKFTVNGHKLDARYHSYIRNAVDQIWSRAEPVRIQTCGNVPSASGTGSSAALTVATVASLLQLQSVTSDPLIAQTSFQVERSTQGGGSPTDTSASLAGGAVLIQGGEAPSGAGEFLWQARAEHLAWQVERMPIAPLRVVIANSGVKGRTDEMVALVRQGMESKPKVAEAIEKLGSIALDALPALAQHDLGRIGELMGQAQTALTHIGVDHPALSRLRAIAHNTKGTYGCKLTGSGGGGSIVALTSRPQALVDKYAKFGIRAFESELGGPGLQRHQHMYEVDEDDPSAVPVRLQL